MTPDTPTTATAAMSELLAKHPRPWNCYAFGTLHDGTPDMIQDAHGIHIMSVNRGLGKGIVSAVNATGADFHDFNGKMIPNGFVSMGVGDGSGSLFVHGEYEAIKNVQSIIINNGELRSTLAAAREQHKHYQDEIERLKKRIEFLVSPSKSDSFEEYGGLLGLTPSVHPPPLNPSAKAIVGAMVDVAEKVQPTPTSDDMPSMFRPLVQPTPTQEKP